VGIIQTGSHEWVDVGVRAGVSGSRAGICGSMWSQGRCEWVEGWYMWVDVGVRAGVSGSRAGICGSMSMWESGLVCFHQP